MGWGHSGRLIKVYYLDFSLENDVASYMRLQKVVEPWQCVAYFSFLVVSLVFSALTIWQTCLGELSDEMYE